MDKQWKVVPVEPTPEMQRAAFDTCEIDPGSSGFETGTHARDAIYAAMLAAAPQPPSASDERDAFHAWCKAHPKITDWSRNPGGEYQKEFVKRCWDAWQARAELAPSPGVDAAEQKPIPSTVAWVQNGIADFIADNWPMRKHTLAEIEAGIRAIEIRMPLDAAAPSPAASADEWMAEAERLTEALALTWDRSIADMSAARASLIAHLKARP